MKENRYHIDESKLSSGMVNEPVAAYRDAAIAESVEKSSTIGWDENEIPVLNNHFSYESLLDSIEYCETIKNDASKWESVETFNERLYQEFPWLR